MITYDKNAVKQRLTTDDIFQIVNDFGGEPQYTNFGFVSATICHNEPGEGSHKLYYYENSGLFNCYSECGIFDIFELVQKVFRIQRGFQENDLNYAVRWVASRIGFSGIEVVDDSLKNEDWEIFKRFEKIENETQKSEKIVLKEYDPYILSKINYNVKITPWLNDNISQEILDFAGIGYFPGGEQIVIPHYDIDNRLIGIRGRSLVKAEADRFGKYRPLKINNIQYNHPLGFNLYGLNWAKDNIKILQKVIIVESEKSVLQYMSYFGKENSICVACCGSNLTSYQTWLLEQCGAKEIILAFDKQFQSLETDEAKQWQKKLLKFYQKNKNDINFSFIWDKYDKLKYKDSPTDEGKETFLFLFNHRILGGE